MTPTTLQAELIQSIAELDENTALEIVGKRVALNHDPLEIIEDCQEGMRQVGSRYENGQYYLAGLVMGGEIFRQVMEIVQPIVESQISSQGYGEVLLGTVMGDIHDIGKDIFNMLLSCHKFTVHDLGVDVQPEEFVAQTSQLHPDIVALSGVLTSSFDAMKETISSLRSCSEFDSIPILIGGRQINQQIYQYVGADYWASDAMTGVELCHQLMKEHARK